MAEDRLGGRDDPTIFVGINDIEEVIGSPPTEAVGVGRELDIRARSALVFDVGK